MTTFTLKLIAMTLMVLDHVYTYIPNMPLWFGYLGRLVAPIFFFLIVEGFFHTRDKTKYMLRLLAFGVFMIGIDLILGIPNNIFLSLAAGVGLLSSIDYGKRTKKYVLSTILSLLIGAAMVFTEASFYGLGMVLIFYFFKEKKIWRIVAYSVFSLLPILPLITSPEAYNELFVFDYQWMMVFSGLFFILYNGQKGFSNAFIKWMFYAFYPLHLFIVVLIGRMQ